MRSIATKLSFANAVSLTALFIALGGSAYAALSLPANSVGTKQIKDGAVTLGKISGFAKGSLRGKTGPRGFQGVQGLQGTQGVPGTPGAAGATRVTVRNVMGTALPGASPTTVVAACTGNEVAVGGGGALNPLPNVNGDAIVASFPVSSGGGPPNEWLVSGRNAEAGSLSLTAYVVCAAP